MSSVVFCVKIVNNKNEEVLLSEPGDESDVENIGRSIDENS